MCDVSLAHLFECFEAHARSKTFGNKITPTRVRPVCVVRALSYGIGLSGLMLCVSFV